MTKQSVQILLGVLLTIAGLFWGLVHSIEEPPYKGENQAMWGVIALNALWLLPYTVYYLNKGDKANLRKSVFTYLVFVLPFVAYNIYTTSFNSQKWKSEIGGNRSYQINDKAYQPHRNGKMVTDIINSKILLGLSTRQVEETLGKNYFIHNHFEDTVFSYFYANQTNIFDGCNQLWVFFKEGKCIKTSYGGCD